MTSLNSLADLKTTNLKSEPEVIDDSAIVYERKVDKHGRSYATGKRKNSIAKVWLKSGSGKIIVNGRDITEYFVRPVLRMVINQPFQTLAEESKYDIMATVLGGGLSGQAGALRHGISKALFLFNPDFRPELKTAGFLTRDPRVVERKKYGHKKARRSFQFVKR
jgi:small subunit ribosomal protein S9